MAATSAGAPKTGSRGFGFGKSLVVTLPMALLIAVLLIGQGGLENDPFLLAASAITWCGLSAAFFLMLSTGKTHRIRSILFVLMSLALVYWFLYEVFAARGSNIVTEAVAIQGGVPFCHLVIPMIILPAILTGTIIFPGSLLTGFASIAGMLVLWLGTTLAIGRGLCSWMCFYGGWDEGFSKILKKPVIRSISPRWTLFPWAFLLFIVLASAATLTPVFCEWFCPFKAVTEFGEINSAVAVVQTVIFVALFLGLVVVLPILTKRRTQCGLFCPLGAMQSLSNAANVFDVRIDTERCTLCGLCIRLCPTFSIDAASLRKGRTLLTCTKCGQCVDACPRQAIAFHIRGTGAGIRPNLARVLFLYPAFLVFTLMGGGMIAFAIGHLLRYLFTGSLA
jgi:ferredoxin-type protein NapH